MGQCREAKRSDSSYIVLAKPVDCRTSDRSFKSDEVPSLAFEGAYRTHMVSIRRPLRAREGCAWPGARIPTRCLSISLLTKVACRDRRFSELVTEALEGVSYGACSISDQEVDEYLVPT